MTKQQIDDMITLDRLAEEAGGYVCFSPNSQKEPHYNYREIEKYCKEKKKDPLDLTIREMQRFIVNP